MFHNLDISFGGSGGEDRVGILQRLLAAGQRVNRSFVWRTLAQAVLGEGSDSGCKAPRWRKEARKHRTESCWEAVFVFSLLL